MGLLGFAATRRILYTGAPAGNLAADCFANQKANTRRGQSGDGWPPRLLTHLRFWSNRRCFPTVRPMAFLKPELVASRRRVVPVYPIHWPHPHQDCCGWVMVDLLPVGWLELY